MGRKLGRQLGRIEDPLEFARQRTKNRRWGELVSAAEPIVWICSARDKVRNIRNIGRMLGSPQNPPSSSWNPAFERLSTCVSTARRLQAGRLLTEGLEQFDAVTERAGRIPSSRIAYLNPCSKKQLVSLGAVSSRRTIQALRTTARRFPRFSSNSTVKRSPYSSDSPTSASASRAARSTASIRNSASVCTGPRVAAKTLALCRPRGCCGSRQ
jgi:hypothetical protein